MWTKNISRLSIFLLVVILVNLARAQTDATTNSPSQDLDGEAVDSTTVIGDGEVPLEPETTTDINENESENNSETNDNNAEITNSEDVTEAQTEVNENSSNNVSTTPVEENSTAAAVEENGANSGNIETTQSAAVEPASTTTTAPPAEICTAPAVQAHETDCHQYYECSLEGSQDGNTHLVAKSCPEKQAFNTELNRCSRDISSCSLDIQCSTKGGIDDPLNNNSYYLCEPRLDVVGFRIFHIDCASYEIYYPLLRKCFADPGKLNLFSKLEVKDIDIVKAELKLLKKQDKLKLKEEKKLQKEAAKKAKEEEKLNKKKSKEEAVNFVCVEEGNFASQIADNFYIACIDKKGKLKAISMKCTFGLTFNPGTGSCVSSATSDKSGINNDDRSISNDDGSGSDNDNSISDDEDDN